MRPSLEIERADTNRENGTSDGNRILITVISQAATETIKNRLGILSGPLIKINYSIINIFSSFNNFIKVFANTS